MSSDYESKFKEYKDQFLDGSFLDNKELKDAISTEMKLQKYDQLGKTFKVETNIFKSIFTTIYNLFRSSIEIHNEKLMDDNYKTKFNVAALELSAKLAKEAVRVKKFRENVFANITRPGVISSTSSSQKSNNPTPRSVVRLSIETKHEPIGKEREFPISYPQFSTFEPKEIKEKVFAFVNQFTSGLIGRNQSENRTGLMQHIKSQFIKSQFNFTDSFLKSVEDTAFKAYLEKSLVDFIGQPLTPKWEITPHQSQIFRIALLEGIKIDFPDRKNLLNEVEAFLAKYTKLN